MKKKIYSLFLLTIIVAYSCSRTSSTDTTQSNITEQTEQPSVDLTGQWYIENIVFNDSTNVRPKEEVPGSQQYITFDADTYSIITNCNSISGAYMIEGDSIHIDNGAMTEIACDNMVTEDALRKILPNIATVDVTNDSIVRLNCTDASSYIILRKSPIQVKCHVE